MSLKKAELKHNCSLKDYTTIKIGGDGYLFAPHDRDQLHKNIIELGEDFYLLGGGSNLLIKDTAIEKPIIKLGDGFKYIEPYKDKDCLEVGGATLLADLLNYCIKNELEGLERLAGIPATIGGIIANGASSFGFNISSYLDKVEVMDRRGIAKELSAEGIDFSYRSSSLKGEIIVRAWFKLKKSKSIKERIKEFVSKRLASQDFGYPSCGCIFKNPKITNSEEFKKKYPKVIFPKDSGNLSAGYLIDLCGLKGEQKNDACISLKHANFIVNLGRARYNDVSYLIDKIKDEVYRRYAISLEEEVEKWV